MPFDHNDHYHRTMARLVPGGARTALDVGCGTGRFARRLAGLGIEVDAVDPAPEVIEAASAAPVDGVRFLCADVTRMELPAGRYDYISCLASLHHMPFGTVAALRDALAPGGVLAVLGCYPERTTADFAWSLAAVPVNAAARVAVAAAERARGPRPRAVRAPVRPPEMSLEEIRREAASLLPGFSLRRRLFWRYLLTYRKPS
ncbi:class I SAM-dependent methyltransferase [Nonomuraea sp. NPDC052265]|uniref:class I SAM-dependent methyltransferase n=1 Tax=Nonomuraea sp. NPDC052265 TaxID=3364374 RepID=UPI0037C6368F